MHSSGRLLKQWTTHNLEWWGRWSSVTRNEIRFTEAFDFCVPNHVTLSANRYSGWCGTGLSWVDRAKGSSKLTSSMNVQECSRGQRGTRSYGMIVMNSFIIKATGPYKGMHKTGLELDDQTFAAYVTHRRACGAWGKCWMSEVMLYAS